MSDSKIQTDVYRRQRVQRLKKCIILMLILLDVIFIGLCFFLAAKINRQDQALNELQKKMEVLTEYLLKQSEELGGLREELNGFREETEREIRSLGEELTDIGQSDQTSQVQDEKSDEPEAAAGRRVYLTFDDGPSMYTEDILDILDEYGVKATFFVVGKEGDKAKERLNQIVERGHTLGMHSYSHKYSEIYESVDNFAADYEKLRDYLYEVTGVNSIVYRFPGGSSNTVSDLDMHIFADYLTEQGINFFDWNVSSGDGGRNLLSVDQLVENVISGIGKKRDSVVLMHDSADKSTTVEALPTIIEKILAMEDTVILPITEDTKPVQHLR